MRIGTLFSGIGSPEQASKRVFGNNFELVFACEWDKYARESFKANYEIDDKHFHKDINDMDGNQYKNKIDILIGGSPCQDFSLAGLRAGIDGQKGILIYQYIRMIKEVQPPIFIYENVKGMLSDKKGKTIKDFVEAFRDLGYFCHYEVLNTKDYGVPQNRERIFLVGFKDKEHYYNFNFAPKIKLEKRLKDILEDNVDEKYYLSDKIINNFINRKQSKNYPFVPKTGEDISCCLNARYYKMGATDNYIKVLSATKQGYEVANIGDSINLTHPQSTTRRGRVGKEVAQTLDCACNQAVVENKVAATQLGNGEKFENATRDDGIAFCLRASEPNGIITNFRIRRLTPRECFRLQDFPDSFRFVVSNTQLYKQAGNSISVNVMEMILRQIVKSKENNIPKDRLF